MKSERHAARVPSGEGRKSKEQRFGQVSARAGKEGRKDGEYKQPPVEVRVQRMQNACLPFIHKSHFLLDVRSLDP